MVGLTAAAFLSLAASCAPDVAPQTLLAIAKVESALAPFAINDNTDKREYAPADRDDAIKIATRLHSAGHNIDSGIMQVNNRNLTWLGVSLVDTFDPCTNIRAGATELISYSKYNTGSATRGFANGYVAKVLRARFDQTNAAETAAAPPSQPKKSEPQGWSGGGFADEEGKDDVTTASAVDLPPVLVQASAEMPQTEAEDQVAEQPADPPQNAAPPQ